MSKSKKNYILGKVVRKEHFSRTFFSESFVAGEHELTGFWHTIIRSNSKYHQFVNQKRPSGEVLFYVRILYEGMTKTI